MAGRCPEQMEREFIRDCSRPGVKASELAKKYGRKKRTINEWRQRLRAEGKIQDDERWEGSSFTEDGNYAEARAETIQTLEQLLDTCRVDRDVWEVKDWKPNCWQVGAKEQHADLSYVEGKASGWLKKFGLKIHNLWQVKATLVRKEPIALSPVIRPITSTATYKRNEQTKQKTGRALILPDAHFGFSWQPPHWKLKPFHDRSALDVALQIAEDVESDAVIILGDWQDLTVWQDKFARLPEFYGSTQPSLEECFWWLSQFRQAQPIAEFQYHGGNHEARMESATALHLQEAYNLRPADMPKVPAALSIVNLLGLESLGIRYVSGYPDDITWLGESIQIQHGHIARQKPLASVTELLKQGRFHQICGHVHRDELISESRLNGDGRMSQVTAYCPGCLCHTDGRVPGSSIRHNWRQGIGVVDWYENTITIHHISINNGQAIWNGKLYTSRNRLPDLKADLPDWNW